MFSGAWPADPVGCFAVEKEKSICQVYFNSLKTSNPTNPGRWKLCKLASTPAPHEMAPHLFSSSKMSNTCPEGYGEEASEKECRRIANQFCKKGFMFSGAWPADPVGCFAVEKEKSICQVYFNSLKTSNPTNP